MKTEEIKEAGAAPVANWRLSFEMKKKSEKKCILFSLRLYADSIVLNNTNLLCALHLQANERFQEKAGSVS